MTVALHPQTIEMIPVDAIHVLNPRARNRRQHREIVENISAIGLKRPITVSRRKSEDSLRYDLVCGEGRLEAFRLLGETKIPAVVLDVAEADCLMMSLVENIARQLQRPIDHMAEIGKLAKRGYNAAEIAEKIGCSRGWVDHVVICPGPVPCQRLQPNSALPHALRRSAPRIGLLTIIGWPLTASRY